MTSTALEFPRNACRFSGVAGFTAAAATLIALIIFIAANKANDLEAAAPLLAVLCTAAVVAAVLWHRWNGRKDERFEALRTERDRVWGDDRLRRIISDKDADAAAALRTQAARARDAKLGSWQYAEGKVDGREAFELTVALEAWDRLRDLRHQEEARVEWLDGPARGGETRAGKAADAGTPAPIIEST